MTRKVRLLQAIASMGVISAITVGDGVARVYPGLPNCPWANPNNSWTKYINQEYGDPAPMFSIHFSRTIGDIEGGHCYTVVYRGNFTWSVNGKIANRRSYESKVDERKGGDPLKGEINVWGGRFTFNEAGEVTYSQDGKPAGQMYCHIGRQCWK